MIMAMHYDWVHHESIMCLLNQLWCIKPYVKLMSRINIHQPRLLDIINNRTHSCFGLGYFATQAYLQKYSYMCIIDTEICHSRRLRGRPRIPIQGH